MRAYYLKNREILKARAKENFNAHKTDEEWMKKRRKYSIGILKKFRDKLKHDPNRLSQSRKMAAIRTLRWYHKKKSDEAWNRERLKKTNTANKKRYAIDPWGQLIYSHRRRARINGAQGSHSVAQWKARVYFYGWKCFYCRKKLGKGTLTKEHRIPLAKGGTDFASNLVPACRSCNSKAYCQFQRKRKMA